MLWMLASGGLAAASMCGLYGIPVAARLGEQRQLRARVSQGRLLVLTYDDGPGAQLTPALRSVLASHHAKATFFLLGSRAAAAPEVVAQLQADGHELGCHTQYHRHAWKTAPWQTLRDMDQGYETMRRWLPQGAAFRPPYGKMVLPTWWALRRREVRVAWWTIDSGDTHPALSSPQAVAEAATRAGGGVVLMHDFDRQRHRKERADFVLQTTELLLETAKKEGLNVGRYSDVWKATVQGVLR